MLPKFQRSSKGHPCPVCGRTKTDCSITPDGQMVLCHHNFGDTCPDGWRYVGPAKDHRTGTFVKAVAKTDRPWGQTFRHEYHSFNGTRHIMKREYPADRTKKKCGWAKPLGDDRETDLLPYHWESVKDCAEIFIVEGELKADQLSEHGLPATSCRVWSKAQASLFTGKTVVILPDCDRTGIEKAHTTAKLLAESGVTVKWCALPRIGSWEYPPEKDGLDSYDFFVSEGTVDELRSHITEYVPAIEADTDDETLDVLQALTNYTKPQSGLLPETLENAYAGLARRLGLSPELYHADLLSVAGSLIPVGTKLQIDSGTGYYAPPIFWVGTVGETGSMKSPKIRASIEPLDDLQEKAERQYQIELDDWIQARQSTELEGNAGQKKPKPRDYYLSDFTLEYVSQTVSNQPSRGFAIYCDELATFFASFDKYRKGGGDRTRWLSLYDGKSLKSNRKGDDTRVYARATGITVLGGIQPQVLKRIMESDVTCEDGLWSRFAWVRLPLTMTPPPSQGKYDLSDLLAGLYNRLSISAPQTFKLDSQAHKLWETWHFELESLKLKEPSPILRAIYPKMKERAGRIALISHCIAQAMREPTEPTIEYITADTLAKAIEFTRWLINQSRELYAELGISDTPETARILSFVNRFEHCGWVTPQQVRRWWSGQTKPSMTEIRQFMDKVCRLGYAIGNDKNCDEKNYQILVSKVSHNSPKPATNNGSSYDYDLVIVSHSEAQNPDTERVTAMTKPESNLVTVSHSPNGLGISTVTNYDYSLVTPENHTEHGTEEPAMTNYDYGLVIAEQPTESGLQPNVTKNGHKNYSTNFQVGDKVRYTGRGQSGLSTLKSKGLWTDVLSIEAINGEYATVKLPQLVATQTIPLTDLRRA